jgi:hypothetical protein
LDGSWRCLFKLYICKNFNIIKFLNIFKFTPPPPLFFFSPRGVDFGCETETVASKKRIRDIQETHGGHPRATFTTWWSSKSHFYHMVVIQEPLLPVSIK